MIKPLLNKIFSFYAAVTARANDDLTARRRRVAMSVIEGYNEWKIEKIMAPHAPECTHQLLPASLKYPELGYQAYKSFFSSMMPYFRNLKATVQDVFDDGTENKVVLTCLAHADTAIGPYNNEYIFMLYFDKDCHKVNKILEYVDSAYALEFFPRLRAYMSESEGQDWASRPAVSDETNLEAHV
ncbi:hypothetical protein QBC37DRAFT_315768 [Rhypophila decipiens]|uniref:SnoaL-like domain-containing protein n=1 Tax=Rhypophila decipiens TaxID=261697 RepID=A0AAN6YBV5_9PEZI|nr:hypothetical protein QBC37DRAFT_315768 [Rhypophila decipiens]